MWPMDRPKRVLLRRIGKERKYEGGGEGRGFEMVLGCKREKEREGKKVERERERRINLTCI